MKKIKPALEALLFLATLAMTAVPGWAADKPSCRLTRYSKIPMTTLQDGRIAVPVTINGNPVSLLVDTGGYGATLGWAKAREFDLTSKQAEVYLGGIGGGLETSFVTVHELRLGQLKGSDLPFWLGNFGGDFEGLLAPDTLQAFDVDLDFANGTLGLFSPDHCPGSVVYWTTSEHIEVPMQFINHHIRIPVVVDGKEVMAMLDTGARTSVMSLHLAHAIGVKDDSPDLKIKESFGDFKKYHEYTYPFHSLDFAGISVKNPHFAVYSDAIMGQLGSDIIIGVGILRQLHIYIDYKEEKLYITPAMAK